MRDRRPSVERERRLAQEIREVLVRALGERCAFCGTLDGPWHLDHPYGRDWSTRSLSRLTRAKRYMYDYLDYNLRLLCQHCNTSDGARRRWKPPEDGIPFSLLERRAIFDEWRTHQWNNLRGLAQDCKLPYRFVRLYVLRNKKQWDKYTEIGGTNLEIREAERSIPR